MDLTYFESRTQPITYTFIDAVNDISNEVINITEATNLLYDSTMWQWFNIYNLLISQGKTVFPEQPVEVDLKIKLEEYFRTQFKTSRSELVRNSTVEVDGKIYDADEDSQRRLMAAILSAVDDEETTVWVLHDNTTTYLNKPQLKTILRACTLQMSSIWVPQ